MAEQIFSVLLNHLGEYDYTISLTAIDVLHQVGYT